MLVEEIMSENIVCIPSNMRVSEIANLMAKKKIGMVLVMDGEKLQGVISDSDLIAKVLAKDGDPEKMYGKDVMSTGVITVGAKDLVSEAAQIMGNYHLKRLPVLREGKLVGVVSNTDIVRYLARIKSTLVGFANTF